MDYKLGLIFLGIILIGGNVSADFCYQGLANESSSCGGLSTGSYWYSSGPIWTQSCTRIEYCDRNWSSYYAEVGQANQYIVYNIPSNATNSSLLQIRDFGGYHNISLSTCDWSSINMSIEVQFNWPLTHNLTIACPPDGTGSPLYTNNDNELFYEAAMWWNMTDATTTTTTTTTTTLPPSSYGDSRGVWCYQESSNVSTECGGLNTGSYSDQGNWSDGSWSTYSDGNMSWNYTKPVTASNNSQLQIGVFYVPNNYITFNHSIQSSCWNVDPLQFKYERFVNATYTGYVLSCYNSTNWLSTDSGFYVCPVGITGCYQKLLAEEAMWWNITLAAFILPNSSASSNKTCNISYYGTINNTEYDWKVNDSWLSQNSPLLTTSQFDSNYNISCAARVNDSNGWSAWVNSTVMVIGDAIPPYNSTALTISSITPCSTDTSTITVNITDTLSPVSDVYAETSLPSGKTNLSMTCSGANSLIQQCQYSYSGYSTTITVDRIWMSDGSLNWNNTIIGASIGFYSCAISGGGGGGITPSLFEVRPRAISESGERPLPAKIVGSYNETYQIFPKTPGVLTLKLEFVNVTDDIDGREINATGFFKTYPEGSIEVQQPSSDLLITCRIPADYRYPPLGIYTATLVVGGSTTEQIRVTCESEEHAAQAGSLSLFLNQEIVPKVSVGLFLVGLVIFAVWFAFFRR